MVYAVQGFFGFQNAARRNAVMQNVQTRLSTEITWGEVVTTPIDPVIGMRITNPSMVVEVRFTTDTARDSFWNDVIAFMGTGLNGPVAGSYIQQHDCPHDEEEIRTDPPVGCVISERIDY